MDRREGGEVTKPTSVRAELVWQWTCPKCGEVNATDAQYDVVQCEQCDEEVEINGEEDSDD